VAVGAGSAVAIETSRMAFEERFETACHGSTGLTTAEAVTVE
jgi:hypothetical protein